MMNPNAEPDSENARAAVVVLGGGLASYGIENLQPYRGAASYIDLILRGEKAADLPVQLPDRFEMAIKFKTAKSLSLTVPLTLRVLATEIIE